MKQVVTKPRKVMLARVQASSLHLRENRQCDWVLYLLTAGNASD